MRGVASRRGVYQQALTVFRLSAPGRRLWGACGYDAGLVSSESIMGQRVVAVRQDGGGAVADVVDLENGKIVSRVRFPPGFSAWVKAWEDDRHYLAEAGPAAGGGNRLFALRCDVDTAACERVLDLHDQFFCVAEAGRSAAPF
jgi:hypothetical protein